MLRFSIGPAGCRSGKVLSERRLGCQADAGPHCEPRIVVTGTSAVVCKEEGGPA
jgi:hypothetical protein